MGVMDPTSQVVQWQLWWLQGWRFEQLRLAAITQIGGSSINEASSGDLVTKGTSDWY